MASLQRDDRQLIENQVRELNGMIRQMSLMASTLERRLRRMQSQRSGSPQPRQRQPRAPDAPRANRVREPEEIDMDIVEPINLEELMNLVEQPEAMDIVEPVNPPDVFVYPDAYVNQALQMVINGQIHFHEMPDALQRQLIGIIVPEEIAVYMQPEPVRRVRLPKQKSVALKKTDVTHPMTNPCPICYESYTQVQSCLLNCQHHMCKDCIQQWTTSQSALGHDINCPLCREKTTLVTGYRERAKRSVK
jgi:hypothetical protein